MELRIYKDYEQLSLHAANEILDLVAKNPKAVLCLAAGETPRLTYALLAEQSNKRGVSFTDCKFVALDEWIGIPPENVGSCHYFLRYNLLEPLNIPGDNVFLFDALSKNQRRNCEEMNERIRDLGGIDLMLVGVGMNGHIGFNEPGSAFDQYAHVIDLDETSKVVGQKYFRETTQLTQGITLGLAHMLEARKVLLVANGSKKAEILRSALEDEISPKIPASAIRKCNNGIVMVDEHAAALLARFKKG
jgi:glucosamine-6-phosphate isomerase